MGTIYSGDHSIDFWKTGDNSNLYKNTWDSFHLIPTSRPFIDIPELRFQLISIPLTNRRIDNTEHFIKEEFYNPNFYDYIELPRNIQQGQWEFYIDNDGLSGIDENTKWAYAYRELSEYFNGNKFEFQLKDLSPIKSYKGRMSISGYSPEKDYSKATLDYYILEYSLCSPMVLRKILLRELIKLKLWLWDPFNFETMTVPEAIEIESNNRLIQDYSDESEIPIPGIGYKRVDDAEYNRDEYKLFVHDTKKNGYLINNIEKVLHIKDSLSSQGPYNNGYFYYYDSLR